MYTLPLTDYDHCSSEEKLEDLFDLTADCIFIINLRFGTLCREKIY